MIKEDTLWSFIVDLLRFFQNSGGEYEFGICAGGNYSFSFWKDHVDDLIKLFYRLEDANSRNIFMKRLRYCMGIMLFGQKARKIYAMYSSNEWDQFTCKAIILQKHLPFTIPIGHVVHTFCLQGYSYKDIVHVNDGDFVLDLGACHGDTALYFSEQVGETGKVYCFEAMPSNYTVLKKNIASMPRKNIITFNYGICEKSQNLNMVKSKNIGGHYIDNEGTIIVPGISIDDFMNQHNVTKVDFIKMDIEGAELQALEGARTTCRKYHPKLAISIYHRPNHFTDIPKKVLDIYPGYKFYMSHSSPGMEETVLFAIADNSHETERPLKVNTIEIEYTKKLFSYIWSVFKNKEILLKRITKSKDGRII